MRDAFSAPEDTGAQRAGDLVWVLLHLGVPWCRQECLRFLPASSLRGWPAELRFKP